MNQIILVGEDNMQIRDVMCHLQKALSTTAPHQTAASETYNQSSYSCLQPKIYSSTIIDAQLTLYSTLEDMAETQLQTHQDLYIASHLTNLIRWIYQKRNI
jgi:hypothetical protein